MTEPPETGFDQVWPSGHVVLSVIHVASVDQALRNAEVTRASGADGLFLIQHEGDLALLDMAIAAVRDEHPGFWVGANYLAPPELLPQLVDDRLDGIWVDDALIVEGSTDQAEAERLAAELRAMAPTATYFGGVAFKYGRPVRDVADVCSRAVGIVDVVTTSGSATGSAAPLAKVTSARRGTHEAPLALASGVTPANVADYLHTVDAYLVATGVSSDFHTLELPKLRALADAVHAART